MKLGVRVHDFGKSNAKTLAKQAKEVGFDGVQLVLNKAIEGETGLPGTLNEEKVKEANKIYTKLSEKGIGAILDDRNISSIGVKIKDCKVLGTPYMAVLGDKVEAGKVELENVRTGEKEIVTIEDLISKLSK